MAFPQTVLPVRVRIAPGGQPAADPATWVWVDITDDVRVAAGITITAGQADEGARVDPGKCTLTLDNSSGNYSTRNALGLWYGQLAKGTPLRVGTIAVADTFTRTRATGWGSTETGQTWSITTSTSIWSVNGSVGQLSVTAANTAQAAIATNAELLDIDAQFTASMPAVMTGASYVVGFYARYIDANNYYMFSCEFNIAGTVTGKIRRSVAGVETELATTGNIVGLAYTAGQKLRTRVQVDGPALRIKIWLDGGTEPATWQLNITDAILPTAGLVGFYLWCVNGNTNTKPFTIAMDDLEVEAIEFTGTVPEWPARWDQSRNDVTTPLVAAGILRRLQQGKSPLRSPITRMTLRNNPVAYWALEDDNDATVAAAGMPGITAAVARNVDFGQDTPTLAGAKQAAGITASSVLSGQIPTYTSTGTWGVVFFAYLPAAPAASTRLMTITSTGTVRSWTVDLSSTLMTLNGYDVNGAAVVTAAMAYPTGVTPPRWIAFDVLIAQSGGNVVAKLIVYGVNGDTSTPLMYFTTQTIAGTAGAARAWKSEGSLGFNQGRLGHIAAYNVEPLFVTYAFANAANGYVSETAAARIVRLCAEEDVQVVVETGDSEPMGPQRTDTFLNLLYSCEDADLGILYERGAGLGYRPRGARYNRPVELALDFAAGHVAEPPEPTDDDQQLKNQWTVTRDGGSSAIALDQASIDESGLIDSTATINVATDLVLTDHANFRLKTTTFDGYRWPSIKLNLARNTSQIRTWRAAKPFPRMTIAHEPSQVAGNAVDVTVLGYSATLSVKGWDIDLNCTPTAPWLVGVWSSSTSKWDSSSTTLTSAVTSSATSIPLTFTRRGDGWSTTPGYQQWLGSGELVTVAAMTAVSGTGPWTQTATVTRAVNGIARAWPAGTSVHVNNAGRWAL